MTSINGVSIKSETSVTTKKKFKQTSFKPKVKNMCFEETKKVDSCPKEEEPDYKAMYESLKKQIDAQNGACVSGGVVVESSTSSDSSFKSNCELSSNLVSESLSKLNTQFCGKFVIT